MKHIVQVMIVIVTIGSGVWHNVSMVYSGKLRSVRNRG